MTMWTLQIGKSYFTKICVFLLLVLQLLVATEAFDPFGRKKRARERAKAEALRLSKLVVIFGVEINKVLFYTVTFLIAAGIGAYFILLRTEKTKRPRGNRPDADGTLDVVVIGTGMPKKVRQRHYNRSVPLPVTGHRRMLQTN